MAEGPSGITYLLRRSPSHEIDWRMNADDGADVVDLEQLCDRDMDREVQREALYLVVTVQQWRLEEATRRRQEQSEEPVSERDRATRRFGR